MLSRFDRKGNAGFALTELMVRFFDQNDGNDGGEDIGCRHGANNTVRPKPDWEQRAAAAEKAERRDGKARPAACLVKKATTGYAGGHKEFHLWMKKENLR